MASSFRKLQHEIALLDGRHQRRRMPLGVPVLDKALAGGLALGRVHMVRAGSAHNASGAPSGTPSGVLTGFAICLVRQLLALSDQNGEGGGPVVWCPASSMAGSGMLYGAGLAALGLDPDRLLIVDAPSPSRRLAVLEDILRTKGLGAVVAEYDNVNKSSDYWMRFARRTQLAAEAGGTTGFLLGLPATVSGFESLWNVRSALPAMNQNMDQNMNQSSIWDPVWDIDLVHARGGRPCQTRLAWNVRNNKMTAIAKMTSSADRTQLMLQIDGAAGPKSDQTKPAEIMPISARDYARHDASQAQILVG